MGDVFLLGAGFSKAISERMPVVKDLGDLTPGEENFELALTRLSEDHPWLSPADNLRNQADFLDLASKVAERVAHRQNQAIRDNLVAANGPPPWLRQLVRTWHRLKSTIITLNYDTLVEKAYAAELERPHDEMYPIPVPSILTRAGGGARLKHDDSGVSLVKLHGSIGWRYSGSSGAGEVVYDSCTKGWRLETPDDDELRLAQDKVCLIAPPAFSKTRFYGNDLLRSQWVKAREALGGPGQMIYALGYSLPDNDLMVRFLLREAGEGSKIVVVNKSGPGAVAHYKSLLNLEVVPAEVPPGPDVIMAFTDQWTASHA